MSGTNPDGSHYSDPGVPYVSYFNGGDALHGFLRGSYGSAQSLGCVEMPYSEASQVYPYTPIGQFLSNLHQSTTHTFLALVIAEQVNANSGIGYLLYTAQSNLDTPGIIAGIVTYAALGIITDSLVRLNAVKQLLSFLVNVLAAVFFAATGHVRWELVPVMAFAALIGGGAGSRVAQRVDAAWLRRVVVTFGVAVAIELFVSDDLGAHWQTIDSVREVPAVATIEYPVPGVEPHIRDITIDPADARVLYLALQVGYMIKSVDGGLSWTMLDRARRMASPSETPSATS